MQLDTYGGYDAAKTLFAESLKLSTRARARITQFIIRHRLLNKAVDKSDRASAIALHKLIREDAIRAIFKSAHFEPVASYMVNFVVAEYRIALKALDEDSESTKVTP